MAQKKSLLFIGHTYHLKTKSSDFIQQILSKKYDLTHFYFDPQQDDASVYKELTGKVFDVIVLWQIMPSINTLKKYIRFDKGVFFPMYDYYISQGGIFSPLWAEYTQIQTICFSKKIYNDLINVGFSAQYIQYFPKPLPTKNMGQSDSVFFWQRTNEINIQTVETILKNTHLNHIHFHKALDPGHQFVQSSHRLQQKITYSSWYNKKEDMLVDVQKSALYIAPRIYEGIGMSFLEAMALGRCVIAHNDATMNEYIEHGKTGFLYDVKEPRPLDIHHIRQIQKNTLKYIRDGYKQWEKEKKNILVWMEEELNVDLAKIKHHVSRLPKKIKPVQKMDKYRIYFAGLRLFELQSSPSKRVYYFCKIPVFKIKQKQLQQKKSYHLFGFIPLLTIKKRSYKC